LRPGRGAQDGRGGRARDRGARVRAAVLVINFGEPEDYTPEQVTPFLERIFEANAPLEGTQLQAARSARSRELAAARAPGLIDVYRAIGGSPLNAQSREQADALEAELRRRGVDARCHPAFQFTPPDCGDAVRAALAERPDALAALPV